VQARDGRRVVDHPLERLGHPEKLPEPPERDLLQLGRRRGRTPEHRLDVERSGEELGEHAGSAAGDREIGKEPGVVPVRDPREDDALEVGEDAVERLAPVGRGVRQRAPDVAGAAAGEDGERLGA